MARFAAAGFAVAALASGFLRAQDPVQPLVPDRPGLYCGSLTVGRGVVHLESGVAYERSERGTTRDESVTTPVVIRAGVSDRVELRVVTPGFVRNRTTTAGRAESENGLGALSLGVKWNFADAGEDGPRPSMAFEVTLGLPVGSEFARPERVEPTFLWAADFGLAGEFGLSTNVGVSARYDGDGGERFAELFLAAALGRPISPATALFVEVAATRPEGADSQVVVDGGVTHLLNRDVQLDFSATKGLNSSTADWTVAGGVSVRFR